MASIGDRITFKDRGTTREGRIVGAEFVADRDTRGRRPGRWFVVRCGLFDDAEIHEASIGAVLSSAR